MMNRRLFLSLSVILISMLACNIPGETTSQSGISPTPNLTLTELFKPPENIASMTAEYSIEQQTVSGSTTAQIGEKTRTKTITASLTPTASKTSTVTITPTLTQIQTSTSVPTYSACYRSGEQIYANYFSSPPTIDGSWDEWDSNQYPATTVNYGLENWTGSDDLSASYQIAWDEDYLYVAAKVGDDVYVQNAHGDNIYKGDSLEILIDADLCGDFYFSDLSDDDYQIGISPGNPDVDDEKEAFIWFPRSITGEGSGVSIGATRSDGITRIEAAIPWSIIGVTPWSEETFGFAFSVSDNDAQNENLQQSMVTGVATRHLTNTTTWGTLILKW